MKLAWRLKMVVFPLLFLILLLSSTTGTGEERWKMIGKSRTGTSWHIDTETITGSCENTFSFWLKSFPDKALTGPHKGEEKAEDYLKLIQKEYFGEYEYTEALWELNCSKTIFRILYFCAYGKNGDLLFSHLTPDAEWSPVFPGSVAETAFESLCPAP